MKKKKLNKVIVDNGKNGLSIFDKNPGKWSNRLVIGTPMTGLIRVEWMFARYGATIPTNWSYVDVAQFMNSYIPLQYQIADAENLIAKVVVEKDFEWLLSIESDNVIPPEAFVKVNEYMIDGKIPVVSGLYFTKSDPPEPMIYRKQGWGYYDKWKLGDKVWAAGIPFGFTLIHGSIIKAMWKESEEYNVNGQVTRKVFNTPNQAWATGNSYSKNVGTSDLEWCKRVIDDKFFEKAGWKEYQKKEFPFLVDTTIGVNHIDQSGVQWPTYIPKKFLPVKKGVKLSGYERFGL